MEIYNDILSAIKVELTNGEAKPTRVQALSNLAYDKLVRYLDELESKKMILQKVIAFLGYPKRILHYHFFLFSSSSRYLTSLS